MKDLLRWVQSVARNIDSSPLSEDEAISAAMFGLAKYIRDFLEGKIVGSHKPLLIKYIRTEILNARQRLLTVGRNWFSTVDIYEGNDITLIPSPQTDPYYQVLRKDVALGVLRSKCLTPKHKTLFILLSLGWSWRDSCELCKIFKVNSQGLERMWNELHDYVRKELLLLPDNKYYERRRRRQSLILAKHRLQQLKIAIQDAYKELQRTTSTTKRQKYKKRLNALYREIMYTLDKLATVWKEFKDLISDNDVTIDNIQLTISIATSRIDHLIDRYSTTL